ncbi:MAG: tRNA (guanosine(37)-N1)-methyltransferase TrmD [bacterium]|nr:tRNA (guanosine(37)-N1)-methyltransferase TrmD [bacterium]
MQIDILTLFPEVFAGAFGSSIIKRSQDKKIVTINLHNLRHWAVDTRGTVDDRPYGGGAGMVLMVEPIFKALSEIKKPKTGAKSKTILLSPQGKTFSQRKAQSLSKLQQLILICGHYEGVDERVRQYLVDEEVSIGDYVLSGGEIPAMVVVDTISRLLPGVLTKEEATQFESFQPLAVGKKTIAEALEYPHYTRPEVFRGWKVPDILLSGHHQKISHWRAETAFAKTKKSRPDLLHNS